MSKIVIAGAGIGGLVLAKELEGKGHEVVILEKNTLAALSFDWHDDVEFGIVPEFNIDLRKIKHYPKQDWAFLFPEVDEIIGLTIPDEKKDISIHRRDLSAWLIGELKEAEIQYGNAVKSVICKDGKVVGVKTNKGDIYGDLIVDCCGVDSVVRSNLPDEFGVLQKIKDEDVFNVYRGFYKKTDAKKEEFTNKAYLRHLGRPGISWALDKGDHVDILIGNAGKLTKSELNVSLEHLKEVNAVLSNELLSSAVCRIPVRRPLEKMFANGYVTLGDSACMTIPMLGSGIASSMRAGRILAKVIEESDGIYTEEKLYPYQERVNKLFGASHAAIDVLKCWLLTESASVLGFFVNKQIVAKEDMQAAAEGGVVKMGFGQIVKRAMRGLSNISALLRLAKTLSKQGKAQKLWSNPPVSYDVNKFRKWKEKAEKIFQK